MLWGLFTAGAIGAWVHYSLTAMERREPYAWLPCHLRRGLQGSLASCIVVPRLRVELRMDLR